MKKEFKVVCKCCGKQFLVIEEETKFPIKGDKYFCSRSCANKRNLTKEIKEKISKGLKNSEILTEKKKQNLENKYKDIYNKLGRYYTGSKELDKQYLEISCRQSPKWFRKLIPFGLDINTLYTQNFIQEFYKVKTLLYNEYIVNGLSPADIYQKYNCKEYFNHSETLLHVFKDWDFPVRGYSKGVINAWMLGKYQHLEIHNQYKQQWHTTWNNKEVFVRSNNELKYALELDEQKVDYEVESLRIKYWDSQKQEYRCAIPDFYIPSKNMIVEIKSGWTLDKQNMIDKKKAYIDNGYTFKCICDFKEITIP